MLISWLDLQQAVEHLGLEAAIVFESFLLSIKWEPGVGLGAEVHKETRHAYCLQGAQRPKRKKLYLGQFRGLAECRL